MRKSDRIEINAGTYSSSYTLLADQIIHMRHAIHKRKHDVERDAFGQYWNLNVTTQPIGQVSVNRSGEQVPIDGPVALFIPAQSYIEWHLAPGTVHFNAFLSNAVLPPEIPREPFCFPYPSQRLPTSLADIWTIVSEREVTIPISRGWSASGEAQRIKELIEATYMRPRTFEELASELGMPHAVMTRTFKAAYGVPPVFYRNRLRVSDAIWLLLTEQFAVAEIGYSIGFEDLSRFNKQFKRFIKVPPSQFRRATERGRHAPSADKTQEF